MHTDVVVIGGGVAGLACAVGLAGSGLDVTVVERSARLGGRACSWVDAHTGDTIDIGPHVLLTEYRNMLRLLERLGTHARVVWHTDKLVTLVDRAQPIAIMTHRLPPPLHLVPSMLAVSAVSWRDKLSNVRATWFAMKIGEEDMARLDTISAYELLRKLGVTQRFIEWFWASACMTLMNLPLERCSAGALLRVYRQLIGHNAYHFGFSGEGLSDLFAAPAARLVESGGGRILLETEVKEVTGEASMANGVMLGDNTRIRARFCVAAVPPQDLRVLLPAAWVRWHVVFGDLADFQPNPYISSYIWFTEKLTRERFWTRVWSPTTLNYDSYDLSNIRAGWADRPSVIASNLIHSQRASHMTNDQIIQATVRELAEFAPQAGRARIRHAVVNRIPMAIPCPYRGVERKRPETKTPIRGLFLAGDWTRTGLPFSMESAAHAGWCAAEQIWAEIGTPKRLALPLREIEGIAGIVRRWTKARRKAVKSYLQKHPRPQMHADK